MVSDLLVRMGYISRHIGTGLRHARLSGVLSVALAASLFFPRTILADDYLTEHAPKRFALVIGNSVFKSLQPIPSAGLDAHRMATQLEQLGFDVSLYENIATQRDFEYDILPAFAKKIEEGDIVVFYFSGHGFSYGPNNYIAPTDLPATIRERDVERYAASLESIEDYFAQLSPGLIIILSDACRSIAGFVIKDTAGQNIVKKGPALPQVYNHGTNTIIGFAARPGQQAIGSEAPGTLSQFTRSLEEHLPAQDKEFSSLFNDVSADVATATEGEQDPGLFDWSKADIYLNAGQEILRQQKEAWLAAYGSGRRESILRFSYRFSISNYAWAARQWLANNIAAAEVPDFTLVPPTSVELAWRPEAKNVAITRTAMPVAFDRTVKLKNVSSFTGLSEKSFGLVPSGTTADDLNSLQLKTLKTAELNRLQAYEESTYGNLTVIEPTLARLSPQRDAGTGIRLAYGSRLKVLENELRTDQADWLRAYAYDQGKVVYLPLKRIEVRAPLELGNSLKEIDVPVRPEGIPDLIDDSVVKHAITNLRQAHKTITWVAMATAETQDEAEEEMRVGRLEHAKLVLKNLGIDGRRITSVSGVGDYLGNGVRLRFFGY